MSSIGFVFNCLGFGILEASQIFKLPFMSKGSSSELSMLAMTKIATHALLCFPPLHRSPLNAGVLSGAQLKNKPDSLTLKMSFAGVSTIIF